MLLVLALVFAIPTWGVSILAYLAWLYFANRNTSLSGGGSHTGSRVRTQTLNDLEKAVLYVGTHHNGSILGTAFDEQRWGDVVMRLMDEGIEYERKGEKQQYLEFQLPVAGRLFDVALAQEPDGKPGAIFRVRASEVWSDEIYCWLREIGANHRLSKFFLPTREGLIIGAAHRPEDRPETPFVVPASIGRLQSLKVLGLINCEIISLPDTISQMTRLEELKLGGNRISELPDQVCDLTQLRILTVWMNVLKRLPEKIGNLRRLEGLDISGNDLRALPESIVEIDTLQRLYMSGNEGLILSERQEKWLTKVIMAGTEVCVGANLCDRLVLLHPQLKEPLRGPIGGIFNAKDLVAGLSPST